MFRDNNIKLNVLLADARHACQRSYAEKEAAEQRVLEIQKDNELQEGARNVLKSLIPDSPLPANTRLAAILEDVDPLEHADLLQLVTLVKEEVWAMRQTLQDYDLLNRRDHVNVRGTILGAFGLSDSQIVASTPLVNLLIYLGGEFTRMREQLNPTTQTTL